MSMTVERAKSYMENEIRCIQRARYCDRDCAKCNLVKEEKPLLEAYGVAIQALEEGQKLHAIGTVSEFRELKEKATAKEVKSRQCWKCEREECVPECELNFNRCPNCNEVLDNDCGEQYKFCPDCGQQLLWT